MPAPASPTGSPFAHHPFHTWSYVMLRFAALSAFAAVACVLASSTAPVAAEDTKLNVKEGDKFPAVPLTAAQIEKVKKDAKTVSIADLKGKNVVVFFYPKASTKGCTVESCGFRDLAKDFPENVVLLGASGDDVALQQKFIDEHKLPMALLADEKQKLITQLGILSATGKTTSKRITFVVDKDGKIVKIYEPGKIDVNKHPKEVLEFVKTLK
jgi:peroxiredoxin Q/BCP